MIQTALSIGSNLGNREDYIASMERELYALLTDAKSSPLMETAPVGVDGLQPPYLNKIIAGRYGGAPRGLLDICHAIESRLGRIRAGFKSARTADVDILLFGGMIICETDALHPLVIPHPQLLNRRFCLEGLMQVCPRMAVPVSGRVFTVAELYENMSADTLAQDVSFI